MNYDPNKSYPAMELVANLQRHLVSEMLRVSEFIEELARQPDLRVAGRYLEQEGAYAKQGFSGKEMFQIFQQGNNEMLGHLESIKAGTHHQHPHGEAIRKLERRAAVRRQPKAKIKVRK